MSKHLICGSSRKLGSRVILAGVVGVAVTLALPPATGQVTSMLPQSERLEWISGSTISRRESLEKVAERIELHADEIRIITKRRGDVSEEFDKPEVLKIPFVVQKRGVETQIHAPGNGRAVRKPDLTMVQALARSYQWRTWFEKGMVTSFAAVSEREGCNEAYVRKLLPVAFLAPDITESILAGTQPRNLTLADLTSKPLPLDWNSQRRRLGFAV